MKLRHLEKLESIAPHWFNYIKDVKSLKDLESVKPVEGDDTLVLSIETSKFCIVGEAHHFDSLYYESSTISKMKSGSHLYKFLGEDPEKKCRTCSKYAEVFGDYIVLNKKKQFDTLIEIFVKHFKLFHVSDDNKK